MIMASADLTEFVHRLHRLRGTRAADVSRALVQSPGGPNVFFVEGQSQPIARELRREYRGRFIVFGQHLADFLLLSGQFQRSTHFARRASAAAASCDLIVKSHGRRRRQIDHHGRPGNAVRENGVGPPPISAGNCGISSSITRREEAGGMSTIWTAASPAAARRFGQFGPRERACPRRRFAARQASPLADIQRRAQGIGRFSFWSAGNSTNDIRGTMLGPPSETTK